MAGDIVWHYTIVANLPEIIESGELRPATAFVPLGERPITWFTFAPDWENTANKMVQNQDGSIIRLDREQTAQVGGGLARIGVHPDTAPYTWHELKELSGMTSKVAQGLYKASVSAGSRPSQWRGTFEPVPRLKWITIQINRNGAGWVDVAVDLEAKTINTIQ